MTGVGQRFVVLGLAPVGRQWFRDVGKWANEAAIPVDFIKCVSSTEVTARIQSGRPVSALLLDGSSAGLDRDLIDLAATSGCATVIVDHGLVERDWHGLGASAVLPERFDRVDLVALLERAAQPVGAAPATAVPDLSDSTGPLPAPDMQPVAAGRVVCVTGAGGIGSSTVAMGLAYGLAQRIDAGSVLLADMALRSSQALLHDAGDVVPGLTELVDSHRLGDPDDREIARTIHSLPERGYHLLFGLRNERDWVAVGARALDSTWRSIARLYETIVVDATGDFDGVEQTGSHDVEDRNRLARSAAHRSDLVVAVGGPTTWGVNHLVRTMLGLVEIGVAPDRILPCINRGPRQPRARAEITAAVAELVGARVSDATRVASPVFIPERKAVDHALREGVALPEAVFAPIVEAVSSILQRNEPTALAPSAEPAAVAPGSLGTWSDDDWSGHD